jgi:hypothetical protein
LEEKQLDRFLPQEFQAKNRKQLLKYQSLSVSAFRAKDIKNVKTYKDRDVLYSI